MRVRAALATLGVVALFLAIVLLGGRSPALPPLPRGIAEPSLRGISLLRTTLAIEGLALILVAVVGWRPRRVRPEELLVRDDREGSGETLTSSRATGLLLAITALGLALRVIGLGSDLWLDEIMTLREYGPMSMVAMIATYHSPNNHLLNTVLEKLAIGAFGESEYAVRLPALLFGVATIPLAYWIARRVGSRWESLGVALLIAVSYHHIFFSQNARGYTAYLFFSLAAAGFLVRGLEGDRVRDWVCYVAATVFNFAVLLLAAFVFAAHVAVGALTLWALHRRGRPSRPLSLRLAGVFAAAAALALQAYVVALPRALVTFGQTFTATGSGYMLGSGELEREVVSRLAAGFGPGVVIAAVPVLVVAGAGYARVLRRGWALGAALGLPIVLTAAYLVARRYGLAPRLFLLAIPLGALCGVLGAGVIARLVARATRWRGTERILAPAAVLLVAVASLASLPRYYRVPKQPYRASIAFVERMRASGDDVIVTYLAQEGFRYYLPRMGVPDTSAYRYVRSSAAFDSLLATRDRRRTVVVVTLRRVLMNEQPELAARLRAEWREVRRFPATVGDGDIAVLQAR